MTNLQSLLTILDLRLLLLSYVTFSPALLLLCCFVAAVEGRPSAQLIVSPVPPQQTGVPDSSVGQATCGGLYGEKHGLIISPDFFNGLVVAGTQAKSAEKYPDDVIPNEKRACHWIIKGGELQQINLYLSELYIPRPGGISVTSYDKLPAWLGMADDGSVSSDGDTWADLERLRKDGGLNHGFFSVDTTPEADPAVRIRRAFMVISYRQGTSASNISSLKPLAGSIFDLMRGFNLTYRISSVSEDVLSRRANPEKSICSLRKCAFSGRCLITADFMGGRCDCLDSSLHYGSRCEFGPDCNALKNPCSNHAACEYTNATSIRCFCPSHFRGERCDTWQAGAIPDCQDLGCSDRCVVSPNGQARCECFTGRLNADGRSCSSLAVREASAQSLPPCRFVLKAERGFIQTPNFPAAFRSPISCEWVVEAGPLRDTVLYFTEIYLVEPAYIRIFGYDRYGNGEAAGEIALASDSYNGHDYKFTFDKYLDWMPIHKPFVVIRMNLTSSHSMARVRNHLLDKFGFNLTYVTYPKGITKEAAIQGCDGPWYCKAAGRCVVNADFKTSSCVCYDGLFGTQCQYGPKCDPTSSPLENPCINGGTCSYAFGVDLINCQCKTGFEGGRCETAVTKMPNVRGCESKKGICLQRCVKDVSDKLQCACHPGYRLDGRDNTTCLDTGRKGIQIDVALKGGSNSASVSDALLLKLGKLAPKLESCRLINASTTSTHVSVVCLADQDVAELIRLDAGKRSRNVIFDMREIWNSSVTTFPVLELFNLTLFTKAPVVENSEMALVCLAQGSADLRFSWAKDDLPFDPSSNSAMWLTEMPLGGGVKSSQVNLENVNRAHSGIYTCTAEDHGEVVTQSRLVEVQRAPTIVVIPSTPVVYPGESLQVTCTTTQSAANYRWQLRGEDVRFLPRHHIVKVLPDQRSPGQQLFIDHVLESGEYTCTASNKAEMRDKVIKVRMLQPNDPVCKAEEYRGIEWGLTSVDTDNEQVCPYNMSGTARRRCDKNVKWQEPDLSDCTSLKILIIKTKVDGMQVGFGKGNVALFREMARNVKDFVVNQRPLFSRDLSTAVDLLDVLQSLAAGDNIHDTAFEATLSETLNLLLSEMDELPKVSDMLAKFSLPRVEKSFYNAATNRGSYFISGKFPCHITTRSELLPNGTASPRYGLNCPVISVTNAKLPDWTRLNVSLLMDDWSVTDDLLVPEISATALQLDRTDPASRIVSDLVELAIPKFDPVLWSYTVHVSYDLNISDLETHKSFTDLSVIPDMLSCVGKSGLPSEWSTDACDTKVYLTAPSVVPVTAVSVSCLCRLSDSRASYAIRIADNSTTLPGVTRYSFTSSSYLMPVIILGLIGLLLFVGVGIFCWQRKKILSCLLQFKKRTCDFVAANFRTTSTPGDSVQPEIPMTALRRSTGGTTPPPHLPEEVASLVPQPQSTVSNHR
ncbi:hypothetical protein BV898_01540 [Hypsibius exemplaris]|uniref:Uncharacterized protein n=1 Tax=Hypsibius exemplaris TaxID=2072580 RepID=A0A1W0XAQ0_HYPEX|nr:hypothetical protein BV898_01540 [Hypsibius exemplaris]